MRFVYTRHAVEQYVSRHEQGLPFQDARTRLRRQKPRKLDAQSGCGDTMWALDDLGCVAVTKWDRGDQIVVTILPFGRVTMDGEPDLVSILAEVQEERAAYARVVEEEPFVPPTPGEMAAHIEKVMPPAPKPSASDGGLAKKWAGLEAQRQLMAAGALRREMRMAAHAERMEANERATKRLLRVTLRALLTMPESHAVADALETIRDVAPGMLTPAFLDLPIQPAWEPST